MLTHLFSTCDFVVCGTYILHSHQVPATNHGISVSILILIYSIYHSISVPYLSIVWLFCLLSSHIGSNFNPEDSAIA